MAARTLVLAPGLMCDATVWCAPLAAFADRLATQVAEYGALDSLPEMARELLRTAPHRFALAGHSMGGRVALEVMRQAPQRVTHLALLDTGCRALPGGIDGRREREVREGFLRLAHEQGVPAMARHWVRGMLHRDRLHDTPLVEEIVQMFTRKSGDIFGAQIRALLARPDATELLPAIRVPTLVLTGAQDVNSPPAANEEMAARIPGATLCVVERCGHMSMQEQPAAVTAALEQWLQR
jgi:pimeloyl-ACP methyl ester carboxylesterase